MICLNKYAIITGASRGIGECTARTLAKEGYTLFLLCKNNIERLEKIADEIGAKAFKCDVSDMTDVKRTFSEIEKITSKIDLLVNNSGVSVYGLFCDIGSEQLNELYGTNLFGALNCSRCILPTMIRQKSGCIINISSVWGEVGASCEVDYSTSKAALIGLTKALSKEVGPSGITVNCIAPGVIDTDMLNSFSDEDKQALCSETPLCRLGTPQDVANAVSFLASPKASFITGQILGVGGGFGL